ncbi:hypothetical protein OH77DRAFT_1403680 [Trametes cingulata]|nr:hypothetical protein OH77DRAFT_1403680 [Trametes cingulata]
MHDLLLMYYTPYLLGGHGSAQKSLFSDLARRLQRATSCGLARPVRASDSKPQCSARTTTTSSPTSHLARSASSSAYSSMASSSADSRCSSPTDDSATRVPLPLSFSKDLITQTVEFSSRGRRGVCLADWIRFSEKGKTRLCLDDPTESLDEVFSESTVLYQCQWPGYDVQTRYLPLPDHITSCSGSASFTRTDLLDLICRTLADWMLMITRCRNIECTEPEWAVGLEGITFRHVYVVGVVEVEGYLHKWVPVVEVDAEAFRQNS